MKKNILIVDDSALMRRVISDIIQSDSRYEIKDYAVDGLQALDLLTQSSAEYDAVLLDVNLPKLNGLDVLMKVQKFHLKCKVIMVSTLVKEGAKETILALERGAFDFVLKPVSARPEIREDFKNRLLSALEVATGLSEEKNPSYMKGETRIPEQVRVPKPVFKTSRLKKQKVVAIACSTGGPKALKDVIPVLPENLDAPVLLVQHMPVGFTASLAQRLDEQSHVHVKEAEDGEVLEKGTVYLAPGGRHLCVARNASGNHCVKLTDAPPREGVRPCANIMYESLIDSDYDEITCAVLTGMGSDGAVGINRLGEKKSVYVIAQDEETCVVYGMPRAVASAGLVDEVVPLDCIADAIIKNVGVLNDGR